MTMAVARPRPHVNALARTSALMGAIMSLGFAGALADLVKDMPDVEHPVIRTHPVTGRKAIYVREGECVGICGMPDEESLPLIKELGELVTRPEFCYRHNWRVGDLLMWDNSMTQHLAISDYQLPLRRLMHRVTVNGTVPV